MASRWSKATWVGGATTYGTLPDGGATDADVRLVAHTTETAGMPGFAGGTTAPHFVYRAATRTWTQHADIDRRVGTLKSSRTTGVLGNEISVQFEIVAYSDRALAGSRGGIWVGDFTDGHYSDLAALVSWLRDVTSMPLETAYGPSEDFGSFQYGTRAATRMSKADWLAAGGILTAHGAAYGQDHWDSGVLDLHRIIDLSGGASMTGTLDDKATFQAINDLPDGGQSPMTGVWQEYLRDSGFYGHAIDSTKGAMTRAAHVAFETAQGYSNPNDRIGKFAWAQLRAKAQEGRVTEGDCSQLEADLSVCELELGVTKVERDAFAETALASRVALTDISATANGAL